MSAMYRLKAYFGMVPAEEMGDYADEPGADRYTGPQRVREFADDRWDGGDRAPVERERSDDRYGDWDRRPMREAGRTMALDRPRDVAARIDREPVRATAGPGAGLGTSAVRGALAVDTESVMREPSRIADRQPVVPVPEQRDRLGSAAALARITTLQPRSYKEARTIGERYRDGQPVIINLTELDAADAKRLVDFAAGLAFALRGSIDKVTNRVFLLTPADVEVSADDARRLAGGLFRQD
jgi:cell division inhibitor SepF